METTRIDVDGKKQSKSLLKNNVKIEIVKNGKNGKKADKQFSPLFRQVSLNSTKIGNIEK